MPKKIKEPKIDVIRPSMPKKEEERPVKKSTATAKKDVKAENIYQAYAEAERTIQELSRLYVEAEDSRHYGLGGTMKPTEKQMMLNKQLEEANKRANELMKKME